MFQVRKMKIQPAGKKH